MAFTPSLRCERMFARQWRQSAVRRPTGFRLPGFTTAPSERLLFAVSVKHPGTLSIARRRRHYSSVVLADPHGIRRGDSGLRGESVGPEFFHHQLDIAVGHRMREQEPL